MQTDLSKSEGYFLYHSIGMYPDKETDLAKALAHFARKWAAPNDGQWAYVLQKRQEFIDHWRQVINVPDGTVTTCESVTGGFHDLIRSLPENQLRRKKVLVTADCFPSIHFLLSGLAPKLGFELITVPLSTGKGWVDTEDFIAHWDKDVALALITYVTSTASAKADLVPLATHGRAMGSLVGVDITQGAGIVPFDAQTFDLSFVISTSLKWMCGTPGAGIIHLNEALIADLKPERRGWFSQDNPFSWDLDKFTYAPDIRRFDCATPSSVAALATLPALEWHAKQDHGAMIAWNRKLVDQIVTKADALDGIALHSPRDPANRGGSVMLRFPDQAAASKAVESLKAEMLFADCRADLVRLSPGFVTSTQAVDAVFDVLKS